MGKLGSVYEDPRRLALLVVESWSSKVKRDIKTMASNYETKTYNAANDPRKLKQMESRLGEWYETLREVAPIIAAAFGFAKLARRPRALEMLQSVAALAQRR